MSELDTKALYTKAIGNDSTALRDNELGQSNNQYDEDAKNIYRQAHDHRDVLIGFYKNYTIWFTVAVGFLVFLQAFCRVLDPDINFEIMPRWTLDLLITGMFGQFVSLLYIVTKNAWDYKSFFDHHNSVKSK